MPRDEAVCHAFFDRAPQSVQVDAVGQSQCEALGQRRGVHEPELICHDIAVAELPATEDVAEVFQYRFYTVDRRLFAVADSTLDRSTIDVICMDRVSRGEQAAAHRRPHGAESDET